MKKLKEVLETRRNVIRSQIEALEVLRPRIEATGYIPLHYAYSKPIACFKVLSKVNLVIAIAIFMYCGFVVGSINLATLAVLMIGLSIFGIGNVIIEHRSEKEFVVADKKTVLELSQILDQYRKQVEEFEQREADLEKYRPKIECVMSLITGELKGTYVPHYQKSRCYVAKIGFGKYKAERYNINAEGYLKLMLRVAVSLHERGTDNGRLARFIQEFEDSLS